MKYSSISVIITFILGLKKKEKLKNHLSNKVKRHISRFYSHKFYVKAGMNINFKVVYPGDKEEGPEHILKVTVKSSSKLKALLFLGLLGL